MSHRYNHGPVSSGPVTDYGTSQHASGIPLPWDGEALLRECWQQQQLDHLTRSVSEIMLHLQHENSPTVLASSRSTDNGTILAMADRRESCLSTGVMRGGPSGVPKLSTHLWSVLRQVDGCTADLYGDPAAHRTRTGLGWGDMELRGAPHLGVWRLHQEVQGSVWSPSPRAIRSPLPPTWTIINAQVQVEWKVVELSALTFRFVVFLCF